MTDFPIGSWLGDELQRRGMSPAEFARITGLHPTTISKILHGERQVRSWETLTAIAQGLHLCRAEVVAAVDECRDLAIGGEAPTETVISRDGNLTADQRRALLDHYRTYRYPQRRAPRRPGPPPHE